MNKNKLLIKSSDSVVILLPNNLDFDNVAASLALKDFLEKKYEKFVEIKQVFQIEQKPILDNNILIISLGVDDTSEITKNFSIIKINRQIGSQKYSSLSETVFCFLKSFSFKSNSEISSKLLAGIIFETNLFRQLQVTAKTIKSVVQLIKQGADYQKAIEILYRSLSFNQLRLWAKILAKTEIWDEQTIAIFLTPQDFADSRTTENDLEFIIPRIALNFHWAKNIFIFWSTIKNSSKINCWIKASPEFKEKIIKNQPQINLTSGIKKDIINQVFNKI